ncbi:MAG: amino acid ABC transporter permease [Proteobacteria bacterium]|nr:amino acid ABC transporter permease [Pseudomonadota bacterium]
MSFDPAFALAIVPSILGGLGSTLLVAALSSVGAALLGLLWELLRRLGRPLSQIMQFHVDFIRSTPVLVQIYFLYFVLPQYGVRIPTYVVGVFALSFYYSGYLAEVFRAGIDAIPKGQTEAARALGLGRLPLICFILLPQMLRNIAAPMGGYFVSILKATPYLAVIAVPEILGSAFDVASETYRYAEPMLVAELLFLALALSIAQAVTRLEKKLFRPLTG